MLVEDTDQRGAVIGLMRHHIPWPHEPASWPVTIEIKGSSDQVLDFEEIDTRLLGSGLRALGIVFDADDKFDTRWGKLKEFCARRFNNVPKEFPEGGLIIANSAGLRFGAWIMPDNKSVGMLEHFCKLLVPATGIALWSHAEDAVKAAKKIGAPWRPTHGEKATIHTWLAWQDPPGERMGTAITKKILDPTSPHAQPFVEWFRNLYEV